MTATDLEAGDLADSPPPRRRRTGRLLAMSAAAVIVAAIVVAVLASNGGDDESDAPPVPRLNVIGDPNAAVSNALPDKGPVRGTLRVVAGPNEELAFTPNELTARTGVYRVTVEAASSGHNFGFLASSTTLSHILEPSFEGETASGRVFFPEAGDYEFACFVPGHAGMTGVVHVTGPRVKLEEALADAR
jgi:plastocyanin